MWRSYKCSFICTAVTWILLSLIMQVNGQNFVRNWSAKVPGVGAADVNAKPLREVVEETSYFDGLGRLMQSVQRKGSLKTNPNDLSNSSSAVDLVKISAYNEVGLEEYKYLPFGANNAGGNPHINDGLYKATGLDQLTAFYNGGSGPLANQAENDFYAKVVYENAQSARVLETFRPGVNWAGTASNSNPLARRSTKVQVLANTSADQVRIWNVTVLTGGQTSYQTPGVYNSRELIKTITTTPEGKQLVIFENKQGKTILRKAQIDPSVIDNGQGQNHTGYACTYYIYDDYDQLRAVLQPEGVFKLDPASGSVLGWDLMASQQIRDGLLYQYEYDDQNRMIQKKQPGLAPEYYVYDLRDKLVMSQDGNLREQGKWSLKLYDGVGRLVEVGLWDNTGSHAYHIAQAATYSGYPFVASGTSSVGYEMLIRNVYDGYADLPSSIGINGTFDNSYNQYLQTVFNTAPDYAEGVNQASRVLDKLTWKQVKVLGTANTYLYSVILYDDKGREIQIKRTNFTGGVDIATTQYNWKGSPLIEVHKTEKAGDNNQTSVFVTKYTHDDLGRLIQVEKKIKNTLVNNDLMSSYVTVATYEYDELGRVKRKTIGNKKDPQTGAYYASRQRLEELNYEYNIQGWPLGVNREFAKNDNQFLNYFGYELGYDNPVIKLANNTILGAFNSQSFDGNVAGVIWKSQGNNIRRKYDFVYDPNDRFLKGDFVQLKGGTWSKTDANFDVKVGNGSNADVAYDRNGNLKRLQQWGLKITGNAQVDDISYNYASLSNLLLSAAESAGAVDHKVGDFTDRNSANDYGYDKNGNLITDLNKNIAGVTPNTGSLLNAGSGGIKYNYLNQPVEVTFRAAGNLTGKITYSYDAEGNKLQKVVEEYAISANNNKWTTTTTSYGSGAIYESKIDNRPETSDYLDKLLFLSFEEGRIRYIEAGNSSRFEFDYFLKDQVDNVRMILTEERQTNTYPVVTLDPSGDDLERRFYFFDPANVVSASQVSGLPGYVNDNGIGSDGQSGSFLASASNHLYALNSNTGKIGIGITLKVMAGDKVDVLGKSFYNSNNPGGSAVNSAPTVLSLIQGIVGSTAGSGLNAHGSAQDFTNISGINGGISNFIVDPDRNGVDQYKPKAAINWILFDDQLKAVRSHFSAVDQQSVLKDHYSSDGQLRDIEVLENGYLFVYVSNESPVNVYFDNIQVRHKRGAILEETHYYPFGLVQHGISSASLSGVTPKNKFKFGGKEEQKSEFFDGTGFDVLDFGARSYDPQLGRWLSSDPLGENGPGLSLYSNSFNNPVRFADPSGLWPDDNVSPLGRMAGNYFNARFASPSGPIRQRQLTEEEKALNYIMSIYERRMGPVSEKVRIAKEFLSGFIPFKDAVEEASKGNYFTAAIFGAVDAFGGSIEKGIAKAGEKVVAKTLIAKSVEAGGKFALKEVDEVAVAVAKAVESPQVYEKVDIYRSFSSFKRAMGPAGAGKAWHHIVEQTPSNVSRFGNFAIHNSQNFIALPHGKGTIHEDISAFYSSIQNFTNGLTVRKWLSTQSYEDQYQFGIQVLKDFGWQF